MKTCIICGEPSQEGRRYCKKCYALRRKSLNGGVSKRSNYGISLCIGCGKKITLWRKEQKYCKICWSKTTSEYGNVTNNYERGNGNGYCFKHRRIAEELLKRKLLSHEIVHHIDENPNNNTPENLLIMTRKQHPRLHIFLRKARGILKEFGNVNVENCWNTLRVLLTTTWLEMTSVKVIKIAEIGQSASEPLVKEEGSETMHYTSRTDEEIVQTARNLFP